MTIIDMLTELLSEKNKIMKELVDVLFKNYRQDIINFDNLNLTGKDFEIALSLIEALISKTETVHKSRKCFVSDYAATKLDNQVTTLSCAC